ncbi:MAG TPA: hypothetical protein VK824_03195, partial [Planctomycetota bacterium]|nr:hypothetical protein [Planctomycetota bacterium]
LSRLQTFRLYPLEKIIERVRDRPDGDRLLDKALCELLRQYTSMRRRGEEDGPPLAGLRLYSLRWERDPRAGNVDRPSGRVLLAEALAAPGGAR